MAGTKTPHNKQYAEHDEHLSSTVLTLHSEDRTYRQIIM